SVSSPPPDIHRSPPTLGSSQIRSNQPPATISFSSKSSIGQSPPIYPPTNLLMLEHLRGAEELHALPPPPSSFCAAVTLCPRAPRRWSSSIPTTSPELLSSTPATPTMHGLPARPPLVWI
uniref:Uncharacterized protein n=1 Tax=Triticum urartu TaxID=4572 RepID=A0A8R7P2F4_TRIUA